MPLENSSTIVVIGGGPAGAFFAISLLDRIKRSDRKMRLVIIEKKTGRTGHSPLCVSGCNHCAGGISPKLTDALHELGLELPTGVLAGKVEALTIHGHWKNIELRVPGNRTMSSVFRGALPAQRRDRNRNFDSFLLRKASESGAEVIAGEVFDVMYSREGNPVVRYRTGRGERSKEQSLAADFLVFACGVNPAPGAALEKHPLLACLRKSIPGFCFPRVRRALIFELGISRRHAGQMEGEIFFVQSGSRFFKIEMSSLMPKGSHITVAMLGRSIDRAEEASRIDLLRKYLALPQIRRIIPRDEEMRPDCICFPNMTVGAAGKIIGRRAVVIGDLAVSRLYKDGIYSAYRQASALAGTIVGKGLDRRGLESDFLPVIKRLRRDNVFGKVVFFLNRLVFSNPILSRILYQAVLTERRTKAEDSRRLESILWKIASGDETYRHCLLRMVHPFTIFLIRVGGLLVTVRNYAAERVFGLSWKGLGRFPTGMHREDFEVMRDELLGLAGSTPSDQFPQFESMYSIVIKKSPRAVFEHLGTLGDENRTYFNARMIRVCRISGRANESGSVLRYRTPLGLLDFSLALEKRIDEESLVYRVLDGFAQGGILVFHVSKVKDGVFRLHIYVAFNFAKGGRGMEKVFRRLFRLFFPGFVHDVLWNHSLCRLKETLEME